MDRGGLETLIFLLPFESAFRLRIINGSFKYLLLPPMLPHSCPPARLTTQSPEEGGWGGVMSLKNFKQRLGQIVQTGRTWIIGI
jgi:hypothetical protein